MNQKQPLELGAHMSTAGGLENALLIAQQARCQCVQLFSANQRQWRAKHLSQDQIDRFRQVYTDSGLKTLVVHASYLINLAATNKETYKKSLSALKDELERCEALGIDYLVLHPGAHMGAGIKAGLAKVIDSLNRVLANKGKCQLLLETTAGQGSSLGCCFEHLAKILAKTENPQRAGVCLDTCHVFAAGYDLRSAESYRKVMRDFDTTIGLKQLKVVHVNDSKTPLGSQVDRHEHLGKGKIGRNGFINLMTDRRITRLPLILETPKGQSPGGKDWDKLNLASLRRYARM